MDFNFNDIVQIDQRLNLLIKESKKVAEALDTISNEIRQLEDQLRENKANFSFKVLIEKKDSNPKWDLKDYHKALISGVEGYVITTYWFLSWEPQENDSKTYRLFLVQEQAETLFYGREEFYEEFELESNCTFKKPLIETNREIRLKYSQHLTHFIKEFTKYLKKFRLSIEESRILLPLTITTDNKSGS